MMYRNGRSLPADFERARDFAASVSRPLGETRCRLPLAGRSSGPTLDVLAETGLEISNGPTDLYEPGAIS